MGVIDELWHMIDKSVRPKFLARCDELNLVVLENNKLVTHIYEPVTKQEARIRFEGNYSETHYINLLDNFVKDVRNGNCKVQKGTAR